MKTYLFLFNIVLLLYFNFISFAQDGAETICDTDDRVASNNAAVGRIILTGSSPATGFIIANGKIVTAGHIKNYLTEGNWIEFDVKPSLSNGTIQYSDEEDRYVIDINSVEYENSGDGQDWMVFSVFQNSITGLTAIEAQQSFFMVDRVGGADYIRITGYGSDDGITNHTQQTALDVFDSYQTPNFYKYKTDTKNGNSGSPVIDESTGFAIGVHTTGRCVTNGYNGGTSFLRNGFWEKTNLGELVTVDQKRESGTRLSGTIISHFEKRFQPNVFLDYQILQDKGVQFQFEKNSVETFRGLQNMVDNPSEKFYRWNALNDVTNHKSFLIDNNILEFTSNFDIVYSGITIKNEYLEVSLNPGNDNIDFIDP